MFARYIFNMFKGNSEAGLSWDKVDKIMASY